MCKDCDNGPSSIIDHAYVNLVLADQVIAKAMLVREVSRIARAELRLRKYVEAKWNLRRKQAVTEAVRRAKRLEKPENIHNAVGKIMNKWSKDVLPTMRTEIAQVYRLARIAGWKKATGRTKGSLQFNVPKAKHPKIESVKKAKFAVEPTFDLVDEYAIEALEDSIAFWAGEHYDANVAESIRDISRDVMVEAGESPAVAGALMAERLDKLLGTFVTPSGYTGTASQYFEGLVSNAMTVGRVYGQLRSFAEIGITKYTIVNPGGSRMCDFCASIEGTTFTTQQGLNQIEKELKADSPADIKSIHPWPNSVSAIAGKDADALSKDGLSLPPYHFRCRCTVDVSEEIISYEELEPIPFPSPK